ILGASIALVALLYTIRTYRMAVDERVSRQAAMVSVWAENWDLQDEAESKRYGPFDAVVHNSSKQPIYQVRVSLVRPDGTRFPNRVLAVLTAEAESEPIGMPASAAPPDTHLDPPRLEIEFTDNRGQRWVRKSDGELLKT
ncbi:MAG: hypothetical protein R2735_16235, partial [Microthrixaceae bacterium]